MDTASGTGNSLEQLRAEALKIRQNVLEEVGLKAPKQELDALARSIQEQRKRKRSEPLDNSSSDVVRRSSRIASGPERKSMNVGTSTCLANQTNRVLTIYPTCRRTPYSLNLQ